MYKIILLLLLKVANTYILGCRYLHCKYWQLGVHAYFYTKKIIKLMKLIRII